MPACDGTLIALDERPTEGQPALTSIYITHFIFKALCRYLLMNPESRAFPLQAWEG